MNVKIHSYGDGFPLVFFHGWGFDHQIWYALIPKLSMDFQLILVDLPGFGQSSIMDWERFKHELLTQLPVQFALIGWSMGGLYATRLAIEQSERVTCLINIASSPRFLHTDQWPGVSSEVFIGFYNNLLAAPEFTLKEFMQLNGLSFESINYDLSGRLPTPQSLGAGLKILESWDLREQLTTFGKPSCFMFGRLDPIVPIKTLNFMQITYPGFHYILFKRAAHMPFLSHMDLFIEELRGFIHFNKSREITSS